MPPNNVPAPTTAVDTGSVALMRTPSTSLAKPQLFRTDLVLFPLIPKARSRAHGAFTGRGSSTNNNVIAIQVIKVTTAHCVNALKLTIPKLPAKLIAAGKGDQKLPCTFENSAKTAYFQLRFVDQFGGEYTRPIKINVESMAAGYNEWKLP